LGSAQAVSIANGSFESGINPGPTFTGPLGAGAANVDNWTIESGSIDYIGGYWQAKDGTRSIDLNGTSPGTISQQLTGLSIGQEYTVSFWLSGNPDNNHSPNPKTLDVLIPLVNTTSYAFNVAGNSRADMGWLEHFFVFTADAPTAVLKFKSTTFDANSFGPALDSVSIAATPLPAALPLFATALGGFGLLGWFRRRFGRRFGAAA
jgi:choice-of-anchor C domain-containing protein